MNIKLALRFGLIIEDAEEYLVIACGDYARACELVEQYIKTNKGSK